jgi:hypothetical protein
VPFLPPFILPVSVLVPDIVSVPVPVPVPFMVFIVSVVVESDVPLELPELLQLNAVNAIIIINNTRLMIFVF